MSLGQKLAEQIKELEEHVNQIDLNVSDAKCLASKYPDQSLVKARKTIETISHFICLESLNDYSKSWTFDRRISALSKNGVIPKLIEANMRNVQKFGNIGAHEGNRSEFQPHLISPCLESLKFIVTWYKKDFLKLGEYRQELAETIDLRGLSSGIFLAILGAFFWSLGSVITRYGSEIDNHVIFEIAFVKYLIGGIFVCLIAYIISKYRNEKIELKNLFGDISLTKLLLSSIFKACNTYCFVASVSLISARLAVALENLHLVWFGLLFYFLGKKAIGGLFYIGAMLFCIACLLLFPTATEVIQQSNRDIGVTLALISGLAFTGFILTWPKPLYNNSVESSALVMGVIMLLATLFMFPLHYIASSYISEINIGINTNLSGVNVFYQIINGIVGIGITYFLINESIRIMGNKNFYASLILSMCMASAVPFTLVLEYLSFGDSITLYNLLGVVVFVIGFVVVKMQLGAVQKTHMVRAT